MTDDQIAALQAGGHAVLAHKYNDRLSCPACSDERRRAWITGFKARLMERAAFTDAQAQDYLDHMSREALLEQFVDDPRDVADEEMSYWEE